MKQPPSTPSPSRKWMDMAVGFDMVWRGLTLTATTAPAGGIWFFMASSAWLKDNG